MKVTLELPEWAAAIGVTVCGCNSRGMNMTAKAFIIEDGGTLTVNDDFKEGGAE